MAWPSWRLRAFATIRTHDGASDVQPTKNQPCPQAEAVERGLTMDQAEAGDFWRNAGQAGITGIVVAVAISSIVMLAYLLVPQVLIYWTFVIAVVLAVLI